MNLQVMALVLVLLLAIWLMVRLRKSASADEPRPAPRVRRSTTAYHAVSIKFSGTACKAAKEMEGRRFLSTAAPKLPLAECDVLECNCRFAHHADRRAGKDRRNPFGPSGFGSGTGKHEVEQRQGRDRRSNRDEDSF